MIVERYAESQIDEVAHRLLSDFNNCRVFAFYGGMGVGKTRLIQGICKQLEVKDEVTSPTFSLINSYLTTNGDNVYHFDFYRLEKEHEAFDIGVEEYFFSGDICLIEWPEKVEFILPDDCCKFYISEEQGLRSISLKSEHQD